MSEEKKHVHKYLRVKLGKKGYTVYKCMQDGCTHYIRAELVIGNHTICWRCNREVKMTQPMAKQKKPHCLECTRTREERTNAA